MLTETVTLPSKGRLYSKESPLSKGEVEIRYMTTREEDILTTQSFIEKGIVLDKLLQSVIVTEGVKVDDLTVGDKQKLLLQTRILGYGNDYTFKYGGKQHTVDLSKLGDVGRPDLFDGNRFIEYELAKSKKKVKLKILTSGEANQIQQDLDSIKERGVSVGEVTFRLIHIISEVDGNIDEEYIKEFVTEELLAVDSFAIRTFLDIVTPDIDLVVNIEGEEVDIPIGINFFYPSYKS